MAENLGTFNNRLFVSLLILCFRYSFTDWLIFEVYGHVDRATDESAN